MSNEWLTTGQMIDRLKVGEVAEDKYGNKIFMEKDSSLRTLPHEKIVTMTDFTVLSKWRILPNYVSFEEAMKALKEGKQVLFHRNGETTYFHNNPTLKIVATHKNEDVTLKDLLDGAWTIEDDTP